MLALAEHTSAVFRPPMTADEATQAEDELLGRALRALRMRHGMSQPEAAEAYGCEPTSWRRYEKGERHLSYDQLKKLAAAVGATREELLEERNRIEVGAGRQPLAVNEDARPFLGPAPKGHPRRQMVITLPEGDATISFPANMAEASRKQLAAYLAIFMNGLAAPGS
ncbi:MAG TPA: helix-turn-helix transcriptional regulator [Caulobacteraceae bacterium]|jgi:transcriptional regulator with XRE-family HTH domain|nr:helix-turn-helix transcriptional regulator [Caulobacteraceae bacterium]